MLRCVASARTSTSNSAQLGLALLSKCSDVYSVTREPTSHTWTYGSDCEKRSIFLIFSPLSWSRIRVRGASQRGVQLEDVDPRHQSPGRRVEVGARALAEQAHLINERRKVDIRLGERTAEKHLQELGRGLRRQERLLVEEIEELVQEAELSCHLERRRVL
eukprot:5042441-Prymnesium_polylepis.3